MIDLFKDIYNFISYLSFVDIIFFVAIITLLILLVTLIYFIKINKDVIDEDNYFPPSDNNKLEEIKEISVDNEVTDKEKSLEIEEYNDEEAPLMDLKSLTKKLEEQQDNNERAICSEYEKDQEEKAIISYDELLKKHNRCAINYEKEEVMDDLIVKKVNLNNLVNESVEEEIKEEVRVISYQKEEAFLNALKELNGLLN